MKSADGFAAQWDNMIDVVLLPSLAFFCSRALIDCLHRRSVSPFRRRCQLSGAARCTISTRLHCVPIT